MKTLRLTALLALVALPLTAQQIAISKENKTIAISTSDDASALADIAVVTVGFNSYGKDQDGTYADATKTSNAIISALTRGRSQRCHPELQPEPQPYRSGEQRGQSSVFTRSSI
jgi:uncharacterized protein YggE